MAKNIIFFSGTSNLPLARKVARSLKVKLGKITIKRFADDEIYVNVGENVVGKKCVVLQSCSTPGDEYLMELLIIVDALKHLGPKKITVVLPFYPYRRQEKKIEKGESITAELVVKLLRTAGVDKLIVLDLHSKVIEKFFKFPFKNLSAFTLFVEYFKKFQNKNKFIVCAPDRGALALNSKLARKLNLPVTFISKTRARGHDVVVGMKLMGKVDRKNVIILDDEISTGGTIVKASQLLKENGAKNIFVAVTHPVLSGDAAKRLLRAPIKQLVITDSINLPKEKKISKIKILSLNKILTEGLKY
jgi:ribose-phosphate pyrophosphokinase